MKLRDACELIIDCPHSTAKDEGSGYPLVRTPNIGRGRLIMDGIHRVSEPIYHIRNERAIPQARDLILAREAPIGNVAIIQDNQTVCLGQRVVLIRTDEQIALPEYMVYYLLSEPIQYRLKNCANGAVVAHLNMEEIRNLEISLPSIDKQKQIANILQSIDDKIELNNRINHNLEEQAQALYKSWFVDFEPFKDGEFVESELGMIPEGWEVGSIYKYINVIYGAPYKSSLFNEKHIGLPLIRIRDLIDCAPHFYSSEILPNTEYVCPGDVIAGMDAEFSPHIWKGERGLLNQRCCKFSPIYSTISKCYVHLFVKPELDFISSYKIGTTVSHLGKSDIDRFKVILPPLNAIETFSDIVEPMYDCYVSNALENRLLSDKRDTLLPKLMSGVLNINEIDC